MTLAPLRNAGQVQIKIEFQVLRVMGAGAMQNLVEVGAERTDRFHVHDDKRQMLNHVAQAWF